MYNIIVQAIVFNVLKKIFPKRVGYFSYEAWLSRA